MKNNTYFDEMYRIGHEWSEKHDAHEKLKEEIIKTRGWDSPELEAWYAEEEKMKFPFSSGANKAYRAWRYSQGDEVVMEDFCWTAERHDFIDTLRKAGMKTFVTVNQSTGLMEDIHGYIAEGCTLEGPCTIIKKDNRFGEETEYNGETGYCVKMLDDCPINEAVHVNEGGTARKDITLTTAGKNDSDGLPFRGSADRAKLYPGPLYTNGTYDFLFTLFKDTNMTVKQIIVDGGAKFILDTEGHLTFGQDGKPRHEAGGLVSSKDGVLFQVGGTATLTLDNGATLQNAYTFHQYGGGAISFGNNTPTGNHRRLVLKTGSLITHCCAKVQNDKGGYGGAIMVYNQGVNTVIIEGGAIVDCWAERTGGAIQMPNKTHTLEIRGGRIEHCSAAQGGGIYLDNDASMKIEGALVFEDNYGTVDSSTYASLSGAHFHILRADLSEYTEGQPTGKTWYESGASAAFYIGKLPFGTYYLVETVAPTAPAGYNENTGTGRNIGKVFKLTVDKDTSTSPGISVDNTNLVHQLTTTGTEDVMIAAFRRFMNTGSETVPAGGGEPPAETGD